MAVGVVVSGYKTDLVEDPACHGRGEVVMGMVVCL